MKLQRCFLVPILLVTSVPPVFVKREPPEVCKKRPDPGACEARYPAWYYDSKRGFCKLFFFSGCGGNSNRFNTELKCQETCLPNKRPESLCSLLPKPVQCKTPFRLSWAFDPKTNICHQYSPRFCGENANKFATCIKCMERCSIIQAAATCRLIHEKMEQMKKHQGRRPE